MVNVLFSSVAVGATSSACRFCSGRSIQTIPRFNFSGILLEDVSEDIDSVAPFGQSQVGNQFNDPLGIITGLIQHWHVNRRTVVRVNRFSKGQ